MDKYSNRQKMVIANLRGQHGWLSGAELSAAIGVCKKTLQNDIKDINATSKKPLIIANNRLGYRLNPDCNIPVFESEKVCAPAGRYSTPKAILILLLFSNVHPHIEEIADKLYLSRTTINTNLPQAKRIASRNKGSKLVVSPRGGLWVEADEETKRLMCAKLMNEDLDYASMLQMPQLTDLARIESSIHILLPEILVRNRIVITGQAYQDFVRFISICILRSKLGMTMADSEFDYKSSVLVDEICQRVYNEVGYKFTDEEKKLIREHCHELNLVVKKSSQDAESIRAIKAFERNIYRMTGIEVRFGGGLQKNLADHIKRMRRRILAEHNNVGHYTKELFASYPLEVHLIKTCLEPALFLRIPDAELGYVVLYVAAALQPFRERVKVLFVSNASVAILYTTRERIVQMNTELVGTVETIPQYVYELNADKYLKEYPVHLTTEPALAMQSSDFVSISVFPSNQQLEQIRRLITAQSDSIKTARKTLMRQKHPKNIEKISSVSEEQLQMADKRVISVKTVGKNLLCITRIVANGESSIEIYELQERIRYSGKNIDTIIFASCCVEDNILDFFDRVAEVLQEYTQKQYGNVPY